MKLRKGICAAVALGGLATLVLGLSGVFSPPKRPIQAPEQVGEDHPPGTLAITGFIVRRGTLTIWAKEATVSLDGDTHLVEPRLEMAVAEEALDRPEGAADRPKTTIRARADKGFQSGAADSTIVLEGGVVIEASGFRTGVVKAERLVWDNKERQGTFDGRVEFAFETPDGLQRGSCTGAEWDLGLRRGAMLSEVELILEGWSLPTPPEAAELHPAVAPPSVRGEEPPAVQEAPVEPVVATSDGEATLDGVAGLAGLRKNVVVRQGASELQCNALDLVFDPATRSLQEVVASGEVSFASEEHGFSGRCDQMVSRLERQTVDLEGEPFCEVQYRGLDLKAGQIALRGARVEAWGEGEMTLRPPEEVPAAPAPPGHHEAPGEPPDEGEEGALQAFLNVGNPIRVQWTGRMEYSQAEGRVEFRRDVRLYEGENEISCRDLTVWFDESGSKPERAEAVGDVRISGVHGEGSGDRLAVSDGMESFLLTGRPAVLARGGDRFEGLELAAEEGGNVLRSGRAGRLGVGAPEEGPAAGADGLGLTPGRVEATWTEEMRYLASEGAVALSGGVRIQGAEGELHGERVSLSRQEGTVEVEGPGRLSVLPRPSAEDGAEGERPARASWLDVGGPGPPTPIEVEWREGMAYSDAKRNAEFRGEAKLRHENFWLDAERLAVEFDENRDMAKGVAEGAVIMEDRVRGYTGKGRLLEWDAATGVARLRGDDEQPAELDSGDGLVLLSRLVTFSNNFRTVTMEAPRTRPQ